MVGNGDKGGMGGVGLALGGATTEKPLPRSDPFFPKGCHTAVVAIAIVIVITDTITDKSV